MTEELEKVISEKQRDQLVGRIMEAYDEGVLRIRDWIAIYDLLIDAFERESAETMEKIIADRINAEGDAE